MKTIQSGACPSLAIDGEGLNQPPEREEQILAYPTIDSCRIMIYRKSAIQYIISTIIKIHESSQR